MDNNMARATHTRYVWTAILSATILLAGLMVWGSFRSARSAADIEKENRVNEKLSNL
jgi:hypothetical protein